MFSLTMSRIAWRNLWRNPRRTGLALAAIALSVMLVLVYDGILRGYGDWMVDTITGPMLGHAQVHAPEWRRTRGLERTLSGVGGVVARLRRDLSGACTPDNSRSGFDSSATSRPSTSTAKPSSPRAVSAGA